MKHSKKLKRKWSEDLERQNENFSQSVKNC